MLGLQASRIALVLGLLALGAEASRGRGNGNDAGGDDQSWTLTGLRYVYTVGAAPADAWAAAQLCWADPHLELGVLVPAAHLLAALPHLLAVPANYALLTTNLTAEDSGNGSLGPAFWMLDPYGGCVAATITPGYAGQAGVLSVPCSSKLYYMCMEFSVVESLAQQVPLTFSPAWGPQPGLVPAAVPSRPEKDPGPAGTTPAEAQVWLRGPAPGPALYRLVDSPSRLGMETPPEGATFFDDTPELFLGGTPINLVTRWTAYGLDAIRPVRVADSPTKFEDAVVLLRTDEVQGYYGTYASTDTTNGDARWAAYTLPRESGTTLRQSYIVRVEGCVGYANIQRLTFTTAGGSVVQQGNGRCLANFAEEAPPGGFLASIKGYHVTRTQPPAGAAVNEVHQASTSWGRASIVQLRLVWAVPSAAIPEGDLTSGQAALRLVKPSVMPDVPAPACTGARALVPAGAPSPSSRAECGVAPLQAACPSFACCGTVSLYSNVCITGSQCTLPSCNPSLGLCGVQPAQLLTYSAHEGLAAISGKLGLDMSPFPSSDDSVVAPVRHGAVLYATGRDRKALNFADAVSSCSNRTDFGLEWSLIDMTDAVAFQTSSLMRDEFTLLLDSPLVWVDASPTDSGSGGWAPAAPKAASCITASFDVDVSQTRFIAVEAYDCGAQAAVVCKAAWPSAAGAAPAGRQAGGGGGRRALQASAQAWAQASVQPVFRPGLHTVTLSTVSMHGGSYASGSSCVFNSLGFLQGAGARSSAADAKPAAATTASELPPSVQVSAAISSLAVRPLKAWSANVYDESVSKGAGGPVAYQAIAAVAVQYADIAGRGAGAAAAPAVLGPRAGTYADAANGTWAPAPGAAMGAYVSARQGWAWFALNAAAGEVVVELSGCQGTLLEHVVARTSTGRMLAPALGASVLCSSPWRAAAPPGGYLLGLEARAGSYVEDLVLVWGSPAGAGGRDAGGRPRQRVGPGRRRRRAWPAASRCGAARWARRPRPAAAGRRHAGARRRRGRRVCAAGGGRLRGAVLGVPHPAARGLRQALWQPRGRGQGRRGSRRAAGGGRRRQQQRRRHGRRQRRAG